MECFNADLKADWERWQSNKRQDFKQLLTGMADKNVSYYEKVREKPRYGGGQAQARVGRGVRNIWYSSDVKGAFVFALSSARLHGSLS